LTLFDDSPQRYIDFVNKFGNPTETYTAGLVWGRDNRDSSYYPTKGGTTRVSGEYTLPGSDLRYYRLNFSRQHFVPLSRDYTLWLNADYSHGGGIGDKELPFYKNYYGGGVGSVRGFKTASLGPCDTVDFVCTSAAERLGGNRKLVGSLEVLAPMPGTGLDRSVRIAAFIDAGQIWGKSQKVDLGDLRYSAGLGLAWFSPIGPMKFSYAVPLRVQAGDKEERFQFQLGSAF
jgi:outer membrane protein insertion porin family